MNYCLRARSSMERRSVTSCYHGSNICGSQQPFLTETAICIVERWKKEGATVLFQIATMHGKVIRVISFRFYPPYLRDQGLLRFRDFATMATWRNYFFSLFLIIIKLVAYALCWKYYTYLIVDGSLTNSCKFLRTLENIKFTLLKQCFGNFQMLIDGLIDLLLFSYFVVQIFV